MTEIQAISMPWQTPLILLAIAKRQRHFRRWSPTIPAEMARMVLSCKQGGSVY